MSKARFLVAKYAPDVRRMEPRNVGVIVWVEGEVAARFAGEKVNGHITATPPSALHVRSPSAYQEWVRYWRGLLDRPELDDRTGTIFKREDQRFLDALRSKSKTQYILVDGGFFLHDVKAEEIGGVVDELYEELVARPEPRDKSTERELNTQWERRLARSCREVVDRSGLCGRSNFWSNQAVPCDVGDVRQGLPFDYLMTQKGTGLPRLALQRVPLWRPMYVHSTAFRFQWLQNSYSLGTENCAALIFREESLAVPRERQAEIDQSAQLLRKFATLVNVADVERAGMQLAALADPYVSV